MEAPRQRRRNLSALRLDREQRGQVAPALTRRFHVMCNGFSSAWGAAVGWAWVGVMGSFATDQTYSLRPDASRGLRWIKADR
jgi:hypothetical protein